MSSREALCKNFLFTEVKVIILADGSMLGWVWLSERSTRQSHVSNLNR